MGERICDLSSMLSLGSLSEEEKQAREKQVQEQIAVATQIDRDHPVVHSRSGEPNWLEVEHETQREFGRKFLED